VRSRRPASDANARAPCLPLATLRSELMPTTPGVRSPSGILRPEDMTTPREFVEKWPLYTKAAIRDFAPPKSITRMCSQCKKETTWTLAKAEEADNGTSFEVRTAGYQCGLCNKERLLVLYRNLEWRAVTPQATKRVGALGIARAIPQSWSHHSVQKIGQLPPQSIEIPADLGDRLGATAQYYKNALLCRAHNLGIAAVAYMRRIVEEKTDELIDVVVELARTYDVDERTIESLESAKKQIRYEEKLSVASELIPAALRPGGVNPLGQLYTHLSVGLHGKTDDECIAVFDDLKADFEYVFRNLHVQATERRDFARRVQTRAGR
jgi:hypothetical protein